MASTGFADGLNVGMRKRSPRRLQCFWLEHREGRSCYLGEDRGRSRWVGDDQELDSGYGMFEKLIRCPMGDVK